MKAERIFETILYAEDLEAVKPFYVDILGLELLRESSLFLVFRLKESVLLIFNPRESLEKDRGIPHHGTSGEGHIAFAASHESIEGWKTIFKAHGIAIEKEVTWEPGSVGLYVRDPVGNSVEFAPPTLWGGGWIPVSWMSEGIQVMSNFTVVYWSIEAIKRVAFEGKSLVEMAHVFGVLVLMTTVFISFSLWRFKKGDLF
jgi:catechol 2,3-dioxygenase-like lactoylglutathione lyase family enzyme